jgi:hypothetical protein
MHNGSNISGSVFVALEQPNQTLSLQPIRFCPVFPAVHFNAGRIDHPTVESLAREPVVNPKPVSSRFVATDHRGVFCEGKLLFRSINLFEKEVPAPGFDYFLSHLLSG